MKELPMTLLLRPFNFDTLATFTYQFAKDDVRGSTASFNDRLGWTATGNFYECDVTPLPLTTLPYCTPHRVTSRWMHLLVLLIAMS